MQQYDSYKPSGVEWIGQIPSHWEVRKFKTCMTINNGRDYEHIIAENGYPVLGSGGSFAMASKYIYDGEVLLLGRKGTIDNPLYYKGKFWAVDTTFYCVPHKGFSCRYLYYYARLFPFQYYQTSTALPSMTQTDIENIPLGLPLLEEQERIAEYLDRRCAEIDGIINKEEQAIALLDELKQTIISEAVTRGLDPAVPLKPSGVDWIGNIPSHWQVRRLKHIFIGSTGVNITKSDLEDEGCPVISYGQIHSKDNPGTRIVDDLIRYIPQEKTQEKAKAEYGDFIFADTSEDLEGCGNCVWVDRETPLFAGYHTILLKCLEPIKSSYLAYLFRTDEWRDQIRSRVYGVKVYSITQSILSLTTTLFPPLEEQERIAEYLDRRCVEIDEAKERKQRQIELLRELKQTLISDAVTGRVKIF